MYSYAMNQIHFNIPQYIFTLLNISTSDTPGYVNQLISSHSFKFLSNIFTHLLIYHNIDIKWWCYFN